MGCTIDIGIAVQRAVTEMHQVFDPTGREKPLWNEKDLENTDYLVPNNDSKSTTNYITPPANTSLAACIFNCLETLRRAGLEMIVLNYTRPDIGISTVKVIVPHLRHFWRRIGPGRLYDVPVKLGWMKTPLREEALNPKSLVV
jgi:ribosomal protein S12 methylthiotransferase accessory factor